MIWSSLLLKESLMMAVVDKRRIGWVFKLNKVLKNVGGTAIGAM